MHVQPLQEGRPAHPALTVQVAEGHLGLDHPELGQVARRVAVLRSERGACKEGESRGGWEEVS